LSELFVGVRTKPKEALSEPSSN